MPGGCNIEPTMSGSPRTARSLLSFVALATATTVAAACGGGGGGGGGFVAGDSGGGGADTGTLDAAGDSTSGSSSGSDGSLLGPDATSSGSGSGSGGSSGGSSGANDGGGSDASYMFDGFGYPDGHTDAPACPDDDGDGWTACGGDCNDHDSQINPCAFDTNDPTDVVGHDGIDNDCDGKVDNLITCENAAAAGTFDSNPVDYANAADLCDNPLCPRLVNTGGAQNKAIWYGPSPANARRITKHMGSQGAFNPRAGTLMSFLSSGTAQDATDNGGYATCPGTDFATTFTNPLPLPKAQNTNPCGTGVDESTVSVHDYTELRMTVQAPINAGSFSFDFAFFSEEYPVYLCQGYNDTFLAIQTSQKYPGGYQIAYDANNHRINVNNSFFQDCNACSNCVSGQTGVNITCPNGIAPLGGTFYDVALGPSTAPPSNCNLGHGSGGTGWLTTTSPIVPGETFTLSWIVFDENDGILDSAAILDHFRWHSTTLGSPVTAR